MQTFQWLPIGPLGESLRSSYFNVPNVVRMIHDLRARLPKLGC